LGHMTLFAILMITVVGIQKFSDSRDFGDLPGEAKTAVFYF